MLESATRVLRPVYERFLRHHLPRTLGVYNGVITRRFYLLDLQGVERETNYKQELVECTRGAVSQGDTVLEIGSGYGVCTVWAARAVGNNGHVIGYEASSRQVDVLNEALKLNGEVLGENIADRVDIEHAVVGEDVQIYGPLEGAERVSPVEFPDADVVVMDCEGAEVDILRGCEIEPRAFIVETHPEFEAPTERSESVLSSRGYAVQKVEKAWKPNGTKHILIAEKE